MLKPLFLSLFVLTLNGCVTIPNTTACTVSGVLSDGAICAQTQTDQTTELTLEQYIEYLEPKQATEETPERAGAICQTADDYNKQKTVIETMCRMLGPKCSYELRPSAYGLSGVVNTPRN